MDNQDKQAGVPVVNVENNFCWCETCNCFTSHEIFYFRTPLDSDASWVNEIYKSWTCEICCNNRKYKIDCIEKNQIDLRYNPFNINGKFIQKKKRSK